MNKERSSKLLTTGKNGEGYACRRQVMSPYDQWTK